MTQNQKGVWKENMEYFGVLSDAQPLFTDGDENDSRGSSADSQAIASTDASANVNTDSHKHVDTPG